MTSQTTKALMAFSVKEKQEEQYYFDYKSEFKSPKRYETMKGEAKRDHQRALVNYPGDSFQALFESQKPK